jgi:hypothetical protein
MRKGNAEHQKRVAFASTSILYTYFRQKKRRMMMMLRIYEHLRVSLVNIMPLKRARECTQKKLWHVYPFYALKFRINFNNKKLCMRTSWTSTVGGRSVNKLNLSSLYHFLNWIYLFIFLLASFMAVFAQISSW